MKAVTAPRTGYKLRLPDSDNAKVLLLAHQSHRTKHDVLIELVADGLSRIDFAALLESVQK